MDLIAPTDRGLYCAAGDFHIDPWRPVARAVITHAHSDHARFGSDVYVCHRDTAPILRKRLGDVAIETARLRRDPDPQRRRDVAPSGGPCARLGADPRRASRRGLGRLGRLQARERRRVGALRAAALPRLHHRIDLRPADLSLAAASGDLRPRSTPGGATTPPRAAPACSTPMRSARRSACSPMSTRRSGPIVCHGAIEPINALDPRGGRRAAADPDGRRDRQQGRVRPRARSLRRPRPPASPWLKRFGDYSDALASGWMQVRGNRRRRGARSRLRAVRPRRLAGAPRRHRGDRRGARVRDPRIGRPADALPPGERPRRPRSWRRPTATRTTAPKPRPRTRREGLRGPLPAARFRDLDAREAGGAGRRLRRGEGRSFAMGERGLDGLFPRRRQAAPDRSDPAPAASRGRRLGASRMAVRGVLSERRRSGRDAVAAAARRRRRRGDHARRLDARTASAAARARRRGEVTRGSGDWVDGAAARTSGSPSSS